MKRKLKFGLALASIALILFTPLSPGAQNKLTENEVQISGTVESLEGKMTTWMYGTHVLKEDGQILYALKDDEGNLNMYNGKEVSLRGTIIHEGVDGGPTYLEVDQISSPDSKTGTSGPLENRELYIVGVVLAFIAIITVLFVKLGNQFSLYLFFIYATIPICRISIIMRAIIKMYILELLFSGQY